MDKRLLTKDDFDVLHQAFCLAFSSNRVELNPSKEEFDYRIHKKLHINYDISAAAYDGSDLIGFILHTSNLYEGIPTAFNGGTGVIPGFRSQKIGEEIYEFLLPRIIQKSIARILLEVIDSNERAIKLYEKIGFHYRRKMLCYKLTRVISHQYGENIVEGSIEDIDEDFSDYSPAFVDSKNQLEFGNETVLVKKVDGQNAGYIVFQPSIGRISQIAVSRIFRGEGVGRDLINCARIKSLKPLTIMNIPEDEIPTQSFLRRCGFENQINQFEMELII